MRAFGILKKNNLSWRKKFNRKVLFLLIPIIFIDKLNIQREIWSLRKRFSSHFNISKFFRKSLANRMLPNIHKNCEKWVFRAFSFFNHLFITIIVCREYFFFHFSRPKEALKFFLRSSKKFILHLRIFAESDLWR